MKIELNKKLDKETYLDFCDVTIGGADFGAKIKHDHPKITPENYVEYIDNFYIENKGEFKKVLDDTKQCFEEIKEPLFFEFKKYFDIDYSAENYVCYLSIFDCNPRWVETKNFQVYYKRSCNMRKEVIVHELTHFVFFDYLDKNMSKKTKNLDKNSGPLWELSEIFNVIFLNLPSLQKILGREETLFYPNLKKKLEKAKNIWSQCGEVKEFVERYLKES